MGGVMRVGPERRLLYKKDGGARRTFSLLRQFWHLLCPHGSFCGKFQSIGRNYRRYLTIN